jgi:hypothetical protein
MDFDCTERLSPRADAPPSRTTGLAIQVARRGGRAAAGKAGRGPGRSNSHHSYHTNMQKENIFSPHFEEYFQQPGVPTLKDDRQKRQRN